MSERFLVPTPPTCQRFSSVLSTPGRVAISIAVDRRQMTRSLVNGMAGASSVLRRT